MKLSNAIPNSLGVKTDLFFQALAGDAVEARCQKCEVVEWVIPIDESIDDIFLANYFCEDCDSPENHA